MKIASYILQIAANIIYFTIYIFQFTDCIMRIVLSRLHLADCIFQILFFRLHFQIAFSRLCFANCCSTLFGCPTKLLTFLLTHKFLVLVTFDSIHWDLPDLVDVKTFCPYLSRILRVGSHSDYKTNLSSQLNLH